MAIVVSVLVGMLLITALSTKRPVSPSGEQQLAPETFGVGSPTLFTHPHHKRKGNKGRRHHHQFHSHNH